MQLSDHLHLLKIPFTIPLNPETTISRYVNVLLVYGKTEIVLIDSSNEPPGRKIFCRLSLLIQLTPWEI